LIAVGHFLVPAKIDKILASGHLSEALDQLNALLRHAIPVLC
jgi:hypothetical protein